jgi:membrane protein required for colicin V production
MDSLPINLTDLAVILVLMISGALAFFRGFVHEVLAIAAWIGAIAVTIIGFPVAQPYARQFIEAEVLADIAAGVSLFLVSLVVLAIVARLLSRRVRDSSLGPLDRTLGVVFGLARGAVIVCILWLAYSAFVPQQDRPDWIQDARARPLAEAGATMLNGLLPEDWQLKSQEAVNQLRDEGGELIDQGQQIQTLLQPRAEGAESAESEAAGETEAAPQGYSDDMRRELINRIEGVQAGDTEQSQ